jgi:hypothetical protein
MSLPGVFLKHERVCRIDCLGYTHVADCLNLKASWDAIRLAFIDSSFLRAGLIVSRRCTPLLLAFPNKFNNDILGCLCLCLSSHPFCISNTPCLLRDLSSPPYRYRSYVIHIPLDPFERETSPAIFTWSDSSLGYRGNIHATQPREFPARENKNAKILTT